MTAGVTHLPATTGSLADCVRADERLTVLVRALLGDTQVATDVASALELRRSGARVVSLEGHVFERDGVMITAGSRAVQGLISRKAELRQLEDEIGRYMGLVSEREARQAEIDRLLADAEAQLNQLRQEAYEKSVAKADFVRNAEQLGVREQFLLAERESKRKEIEAIGRQGRAIADREAVLAALRTELSAVKERIAAEIASLNATRERYNHAREELRTRHIAAREECAKAGEKRLAVERQLALLVASRDDVAKSLERAAGLLGETVARLEAATAEVARLEVEHDALGGQLTEARGRVEAAAKARERMAGEDESARAQRSRVESELAPCEQEQNAQRVEEASVRAQADGVIQRARDEAQLDLVSEAAAAPAEEAVDWEALRSETDELRVKINTFGIVNVAALEQMQELEETEKFARAQQEDLERSKAQLEELIRTLNKESRELFEKTFELVREQFNTIFRKIFGGGNADIILEQLEGVDPMEQGLEIKARPPGKELTPISMLSGGEKSLTAIALVMALFRANPGPFCLLDEADAALDEKNVERYAGLVREFASDTQFIVITHNKRTMAVCDALYGVTMEQRGVSKKVSVNLSGDGNLDLLKSRGAPVPSPSV
jgi:chromosome segregation protein